MNVDIYSIDIDKLMFRNCSNIILHSALLLLVSIIIISKELKLLYNLNETFTVKSFKIDMAVTCFANQHMKIIADTWLQLVINNQMCSSMNIFFFFPNEFLNLCTTEL